MRAWRLRSSVAKSKTAVAAVAVTSALALAAGCSSSPSPSAGSTTSTTTGSVSAPHDAKVTACRVVNKIWLMNGSVRNSATAPRTYAIVVDFDAHGAVVTTRTIDTTKLAPGATITFGASGANGAEGVTCVISKVTATGA